MEAYHMGLADQIIAIGGRFNLQPLTQGFGLKVPALCSCLIPLATSVSLLGDFQSSCINLNSGVVERDL